MLDIATELCYNIYRKEVRGMLEIISIVKDLAELVVAILSVTKLIKDSKKDN